MRICIYRTCNRPVVACYMNCSLIYVCPYQGCWNVTKSEGAIVTSFSSQAKNNSFTIHLYANLCSSRHGESTFRIKIGFTKEGTDFKSNNFDRKARGSWPRDTPRPGSYAYGLYVRVYVCTCLPAMGWLQKKLTNNLCSFFRFLCCIVQYTRLTYCFLPYLGSKLTYWHDTLAASCWLSEVGCLFLMLTGAEEKRSASMIHSS